MTTQEMFSDTRTYKITDEAKAYVANTRRSFLYRVYNRRNGEAFISPVSTATGKTTTFGQQAKNSQWIDETWIEAIS